MTQDALIVLTGIALIWIGGPLHSIANAIRHMCRKIKD